MIDRSIQKASGTVTWALFVAAIVFELIATQVGIYSSHIAAVFAVCGFVGSAMVQFILRIQQMESEALAEFKELKTKEENGGDQNLFQTSEENIQSRRVRQQVQKWGLPVFSVLLVILQAVLGYFLWQKFGKESEWQSNVRTLGLSVFGGMMLITFLIGKYMAGLAKGEAEKWLRYGASQLIWISVICFFISGIIIADWAGFSGWEKYLIKILIMVLWVISLEIAIGLVFEIYRPRKEGEGIRFLFESRLLSFLSHPGGVFATVAQAVDYQFGFKVSETWFYKYLEKAVGWIVLVQVILYWSSTCVIIVDPNEQVIVERWGKTRDSSSGVVESGLHFKLPWPFEKSYRYDTKLIRRLILGPIISEEQSNSQTRLWTQNIGMAQDLYLVASSDIVSLSGSEPSNTVPVNLLSVRMPIQYRITDVTKWALDHSNPEDLLANISQREIFSYFVSQDFDTLLMRGKLDASKQLKSLIEEQCNTLGLGIEIIHISLHELQPPAVVAREFEEVIGAIQTKEKLLLDAQAYAAGLIPMAKAEAVQLINQAEGKKLALISEAEGKSAAFTNRLKAYNAAPDVYAKRTHMEALSQALSGVRKYLILTTNRTDNLELNFEKSIDQALLNLNLDKNKTPNRDTSK